MQYSHLEVLPILIAPLSGLAYFVVGWTRIVAARPRGKELAEYRERLTPFEGVWELQQATDRNHEAALLQKTLFQAIGLILVLLPAATLIASAFPGHAPESADSLAPVVEFASIAFVTALVFGFHQPTRKWARTRMRAETLRLHTHCCLAALPPYASGEIPATVHNVISEVSDADTPKLRHLIENCISALENDTAGAVTLPLDPIRASAYDRERIQEQLKYFERTVSVVERLLEHTSLLFRFSLVAASIASLARCFAHALFHVEYLENFLASVVRVCVGLVAYALTARALFGWESRLSVYKPMNEKIQSWRVERKKLAGPEWGNVDNPDWQLAFRNLCASIEIAMGREALEWLAAVERELYEAPI